MSEENMNTKVIDLRIPNLREVEPGTIVITSKGFKFECLYNDDKEAWKDLTSGLIWFDIEDKTYNHYEAVKKFGDSLPTIEEFEEAEKHGFREILPNMKDRWFWSASLHPYVSGIARGFSGNSGYSGYYVFRDVDYSVRCVGR